MPEIMPNLSGLAIQNKCQRPMAARYWAMSVPMVDSSEKNSQQR